jgi:hypothetical protein
MASQNLNVGTAANSNDGDTLRAAFIKVKQMFAEVYGQTYSEQGDLSGVTFEIDEDRIKASNSAVDGYVLTYNSSTGGFTWKEEFDGDITSIVAGNGLTGTSLDTDDATLNVVGGTGITVNADDVQISDNGVDHDQLAERYTEVQTIATTTSPLDLDASSYSVFNITANLQSTQTLNLQSMKTGQVIDILATGTSTLTLTSDDTSETFNNLGAVTYDGSSNNHIQIVCIDDTDSAAIYNYTIQTYTSNNQPN